MAAEEEQQRRNRLLFVVDYERHGNHVFEVNIEDLFIPESPETETETEMEMEMLPCPVASLEPNILDFAVSGPTLVGLQLHRTFTYDTEARSLESGPSTASMKYGTFLLPVGADDVYAFGVFPHMGRSAPEARPHVEALTLTTARGAGEDHPTALSWRAVPDPPPELQDGSKVGGPLCKVTACFTMGGRLWMSASGQGTFSLDTAAGTWRKEGDWEMPVEGFPAVYVPELGRLLGFIPNRMRLCACDMEVRPPVVREVWPETWPRECVEMGYSMDRDASLAYLGGGKLCIARLVGKKDPRDSAVCVHAVHLQLRHRHRRRSAVEMVHRRVRCYTMSRAPLRAWAFHPTTS